MARHKSAGKSPAHRKLSRRLGNRLELLEQRLLLSTTPWAELRENTLKTDVLPAVATAYLPNGVSRSDFAEQANAYGGVKSTVEFLDRVGLVDSEGLTGLIPVVEAEPAGVSGLNDTPGTAEFVAGFGTGVGEDFAADIFGDLVPPPPPIVIGPFPEDDGSILLTNETGVTTGNSVIASGTIGDGPHGSSGTGFGDFDFFAIRGVTLGQKISVDVDTPDPFGPLDPMVAIWDSFGNLLAFNDDSSSSLDSFLDYTAPANGDYFAMVSGFFVLPANPFDSGSGTGFGSQGVYDVTIGLDLVQDVDYYAVDLQPGDIFGATVSGGATHLTFYDPGNNELIGSGQDVAFIHPAASPLPGGGNAALSWVADTAGTYTIAVDQGAGAYTLNLRAFRPELESQPRRNQQILFLDFDGETIDATDVFGFGNPVADLSPLSSFLEGWGLTAADEDAVIDAISAAVQENFADVGLLGNNFDFETDGIDGHYGIEIVTSRDSTDSFGFPLDLFGSQNVSRVIVGGTIDELGIGTLGIAESIDVGNFEIEETAVVLLDLLSAPASDPNSLNQYPLGPGATIIDLIGEGVGNIAAHEAGHFFANWHTNQFNTQANIMDQGGNLDNTVGVGPDGVFGTADDVDVDFGKDQFVPNEGFTGTEDTLNSIAFGLSTGTVDAGMIVVASSPANNEQVQITPPTSFVIDFIDPYDPETVDTGDLSVNGILADAVVQTDQDTLTFHFNSSPVTTESLQFMEIAAGAVVRLSDGDAVASFNAQFGYDAVLMEIVSLNPTDGSQVSLPFSNLTIQWNEPYDPASVSMHDLAISRGAVVGFNLIDDVTIQYTFDGILDEGPFNVTMADGALTDAFGNLGLGFTADYLLDFGEVMFPVPLASKQPLGSLIYDPVVVGTIDPGDTDSFSISVDPGQTITVAVEPTSGTAAFQPTVWLSRGSAILASSTAASAGETALLQTVATLGPLAKNGPKAKQYIVTVSGANGTTGPYRTKIILNAAAEEETYLGPDNDTPATAQEIKDSFVSLNRSVNASSSGPQPDRGAVLGTTAFEPIYIFDFEGDDQGFTIEDISGSLWHRTIGRGSQPEHSPVHSFYFGNGEGPNGGGDYDTGQRVAGALVSPSLSLPDSDAVAVDFSYVLETENLETFDLAELQINGGFGWETLQGYNAVAESSVWRIADPVDLSAYAGQDVQLRWLFDSVDDFFNNFEGWYVDDVRILASDVADHYSFSLEAGESVAVALTGQNGGALGLALLDSDGNVVAEDLGPTQGPIVNGGFETGDFTGWTTTMNGSPFLPWQVSTAGAGGGFGMAATEPQDGSFGAWNGFDGSGPMQFQMWQDITIPSDVPFANLEWQDRVQWVMTFGATLPRDYEVQIRDPATNALLETVFSLTTGNPAVTPIGDSGWQSHSADLSAYRGQEVRLFFEEHIPEPFTGPAQIEFDAIRLETTSRPTNLDSLIGHFVAPEDGNYTVRVSGDANVDYSLVVTRNAEFGLEDNDDIGSAQPVRSSEAAGRQWVIGHVTTVEDTFYGSSRDGSLFTLDVSTGAGTLVGLLPDVATEIEHDNSSGRSFVQFSDGLFAGQEFDINTGVGIGTPIFNGGAFNGLEWVDDTLYGTRIPGPGGPSELRTLNPFTGISNSIGTTGVGPISGLAFNETTATMYGIAGGPGPANLYTIDLGTGQALPVGSTGFQAGSLQFGPDGLLYGGGTGPNGGELFRIDLATGASTLVGPTAFSAVTGLTLRKGESDRDFYQVTVGKGKPLQIETLTPAARRGEFVNVLDPMIRVYDAAGNLVASDDNSASDGRNARLRFKTSKGAEGTYFIEVLGAGSTNGEYLLSVKGNVAGEVNDTLTADFDDDGFVTGFDFLLWQLGVGTPAPNAVKTDGDADSDTDVDGDDLNVWESQFGTGPALLRSADFDSDGDTDGADFLTWQRGLGTLSPNATKPDGDADDDLDVDSSDLDVWEVQYGTVTPLVAAASTSIATQPVAQLSLTSSDLVDLALAMELASEASNQEEAPPLDDQPASADVAIDTVFATGDIALAALDSEEVDSSAASSFEEDEAEDQWLTGKLLEQVFG